MISLVPLLVCHPDFPPLTDIVRESLPLRYTLATSEDRLILVICDLPTVKCVFAEFWPYTPSPAYSPLISAVTDTLVPGFQNFWGRYPTCLLDYQCHVPCWAGEDLTCRFFSTSTLFLTGTSNVKTTGIPIPTRLPLRG